MQSQRLENTFYNNNNSITNRLWPGASFIKLCGKSTLNVCTCRNEVTFIRLRVFRFIFIKPCIHLQVHKYPLYIQFSLKLRSTWTNLKSHPINSHINGSWNAPYPPDAFDYSLWWENDKRKRQWGSRSNIPSPTEVDYCVESEYRIE